MVTLKWRDFSLLGEDILGNLVQIKLFFFLQGNLICQYWKSFLIKITAKVEEIKVKLGIII